MVSLKILFGLVPRTAEYEAAMDALRKEYQEFVAFNESKELTDYIDLEKNILSSDFLLKKKQIQQQKYSDTPEYKQEKEFFALKKTKGVKQYYAAKSSSELKEYRATESSEQLKRYQQLEDYVKSPEFLEVKRNMAKKPKEKFLASDLYKTYAQYQELLSGTRIKGYLKMLKSKYYADYKALINTSRLSDFEQLKKLVNSSDFESRKRSMSAKEYAGTEDHAKFDAYHKLAKSKDIRNYLAFVNQSGFSLFSEIEGSEELKNFEKLKKEIGSPDFEHERKRIESQRFEDTDAYKKLVEFQQLKKSDKIHRFFAYGKSKIYENFKRYDGSETISRYEELEKIIGSEAFRKVKEYMLLPGKKKYELSNEYKLEQQYYTQKSSEKFKWYFKVRDSHKFDEVKRWNLTFTEDFSSGIDRKKWIARYYWGDAVLKDTYALTDEKHLFTDGKNLEVSNGKLKIITKKEKIKGKVWDPSVGFFPKEFNYTSGIISTGASFRQQYGLFEAKIRINKSYPVHHAFWMVSDQILPHVDIVKYNKKINVGHYWPVDGNKFGKVTASTGAGKYTSDYFIYSLEWSPDKLIWKINGVPVIISEQGVPQSPMYMNLSSGLYTETGGGVLPASMEIDWIRCYQHV